MSTLQTTRTQSGVALMIGLVLLIVVTMIGIAGARTTVIQERMATNTLDRSLSFHAAESALRAAGLEISRDSEIGVDCSPGNNTCTAVNGFEDGAGWTTVAGNYVVNGDISLTPQYHIQRLGSSGDSANLGQGQSANSRQYGGGGSQPEVLYFRVTARSGLPSQAGERSVVVISATLSRGI